MMERFEETPERELEVIVDLQEEEIDRLRTALVQARTALYVVSRYNSNNEWAQQVSDALLIIGTTLAAGRR